MGTQSPRLWWPSNLASLWIPVMRPDLFPASHPSACLPRSLGARCEGMATWVLLGVKAPGGRRSWREVPLTQSKQSWGPCLSAPLWSPQTTLLSIPLLQGTHPPLRALADVVSSA